MNVGNFDFLFYSFYFLLVSSLFFFFFVFLFESSYVIILKSACCSILYIKTFCYLNKYEFVIEHQLCNSELQIFAQWRQNIYLYWACNLREYSWIVEYTHVIFIKFVLHNHKKTLSFSTEIYLFIYLFFLAGKHILINRLIESPTEPILRWFRWR